MNKNVEATVLLAKCQKTKQTYGIRLEKKEDKKWHFTWAFKINDEKAKKEGFGTTRVFGDFQIDEGYKGCPYCGSIGFFTCGCGKYTCNDGKHEEGTCAWCGQKGDLSNLPAEFEFNGGEM